MNQASTVRQLPRWTGLLLAMAFVGATLLLRLSLSPYLGDQPLMILFVIPLILSAYIGGMEAGLAATVMAALASTYFLLPPVQSFRIAKPGNQVQWAALWVIGVVLSLLVEALHRSRQRMETSRELLAVTLGSIGDAVISTDRRGRVEFLNAEAERLTGWTGREALGQPLTSVFKIINEQSRQPVESPVDKVLRLGTAVELADHTVLIAKDGREIFIDNSGAPVRQADGTVHGVVLVFRDCTGRKQAEEVLKEAEERYRLLFEISTVAVLIRDREGIIRLANPMAIKMLKASRPDEIIGKAYLDFVHPEDRPGSIDRIQRQIKAVQGEPGIDPACKVAPLREHRLLTRDGETVYVESTGVAFWHQGELWIKGTFHNITQRKQAEEALRKSEEVARRMARENAIVARIGRITSSTLDIENIYERFAEEARQLIPFDRISIAIIDHEKGIFHHAYTSGDAIPGRGLMEVVSLAGSFTGEVVRRRSSHLIQTEDGDEVLSRFPKLSPAWQHGYRSFMAIPLISNDQVIGVLHIYSIRSQAYKDADVNLAENIGIQIAGAIANAQLFLERKKVEEALRTEMRFINNLIQASPAFFVAIGADGKIIMMNDSFLNALGYSHEQVVGKDYLSTIVPEGDRGLLSAIFEKLVISHEPSLNENHVLTRDGRELLVEWHGRPVFNDQGNFLYFFGVGMDITERKRAEAALRKSEERFRDLYDSAPVGYHEYDTEGRITNVNRTDLEMLGYSPEEMIGQYMWKFNTEGDFARQQILEKLAGLRPPGRSLERTYRRKDGTTFPVLIEDRLNKDEQGRIAGIRCTIQDITERKWIEEALGKREAEAKRLAAETEVLAKIGRLVSSTLNTDEVYELFAEEVRKVLPFDRMSVNIIDREKNTATITYVTGVPVRERSAKESYPLAGSLTQEGIQSREGIIFHPQNEDKVAGRFPSFLPPFRSGLRSVMMVPLISKDRTIGALHFMATKPQAYTPDDLRLGLRVGNQIAGALANSLLFTEFQKADSALRESEEKYRLLVQNANDAIFIIQDGVIRFSNVRTEALFGYSPKELAAIPFVNHIHPGERERILGRGSQGSAVETFSRPQSFRIINKANQEVWLQLKSVGVEWEGKPATLNFACDITEQKKLEAQFLQAQKMEAIGTLAGGIAHDFNNILSGLLGYAELISLETSPGSSINRNLEKLLKVGVRAKDLVKQILTFSRRTLHEKKPILVEPLVKEAVKLLRASLPATIEIRLDIKEDPGIIEADPTQIHQVLLNLCTNSYHAMEETGGLLTIGLAPIHLDSYAAGQQADLHQGPYLRLTVSDTGLGMTPEILNRIFDPYFTTKEAGKGTGLGLAVVHGVVQSHGGAIKVYSEAGKGTTFHVYFPRIEASGAGPLVGVDEEALPLGKGEHILLIDDEPVLLEIGKQMLEHVGYQVSVRTSSVEALGLFSSQPSRFHLVITDMTMPNMTGEKLAGKILKIRPGLPIILCTGFSEHLTEGKAKALGIRELLMKPLTLKDLARAVRRNLAPAVDE